MIERTNISDRPLLQAIGESEAFLEFQETLARAAKVDRPLLIVGERGTGKELAAGRLHYHSPRWEGPLVALNCAAIPPTLIESELFGYEAGAFTGAVRRRTGRFEAADKGTLFLDEIGNIPLEVQAKILRVVEYQSFERVGGSTPVRVDARIVGATNADLRRMAEAGLFRPDLLDRLSFEVLHLPPLRDRKGDVAVLAAHFAAHMAHELGLAEAPAFGPEAMDALEAYPWPGNVRELKNVIERAVYRSDFPIIDEIVFDPFPVLTEPAIRPVNRPIDYPETSPAPAPDLDASLADQVDELELRLLKAALKRTGFNQKKAAARLGLTYHQFRGLYRKHGGKRIFAE